MLTDAEDVSENSEAFVCSVQEMSRKGTLYSGAYNGRLLVFTGFMQVMENLESCGICYFNFQAWLKVIEVK